MSDIKAAIESLIALGEARVGDDTFRSEIDGVPYVVIPKDYQFKELPHLREIPPRRRGVVSLHTCESLLRYIDTYCENKSSACVFSDRDYGSFFGILDWWGDDNNPRSYKEDRVEFRPTSSDEWKIWRASNKKKMAHLEFANFLEDNLIDVVEPEAATLLEVARTMQATKKVEFISANRIENGDLEIIHRKVATEATAGMKGDFRVPDKIVVRLRVFLGEEPVDVPCRFRYELASGELRLWYEMLRPDRLVETAMDKIADAIRASCFLLEGAPVLEDDFQWPSQG